MFLDYKNFMPDFNADVEKQVYALDHSEVFTNQKLRLMPDAHPGKGCTIGTSLTFADKIVPNIVGVDIACRVTLFSLPYVGHIDNTDLRQLDEALNKVVPTGFNVRTKKHKFSKNFPYEDLNCWKDLKNKERIILSMGTLGAGNHYVELNKTDDNDYYLCIHSGSRNLGKQIAEYYQNIAIQEKENRLQCIDSFYNLKVEEARKFNVSLIKDILDKKNEIKNKEVSNDLAYLTGDNLNNYLNDMQLCNNWSLLNHKVMFDAIAEEMNWPGVENYSEKFGVEFQMITCIHNYVDVDHNIIRKGAIAGYKDQIGIIPLNMRDGVLLVKAKGNEDWNCSLPHGAGRILSRSQAKKQVTLNEFEKAMEGIYSTSIVDSTIDESPMAYKNANSIIEAIQDNATILQVLKPVYNFKAK